MQIESSVLTRFFVFCSAADKNVLKKCPHSEWIKYASIGATVFFTGILAALSGGYALYTVFKSVPLAAVLGLFWGALVFNLDRFIVSTVKKSGRKIDQVIQILPRLALAVFLSVIISKPLELKIFEQEIDERMHLTVLTKQETLDQAYEKKIYARQQNMQAHKDKLEQRFALREKYYEEYKCECEGSCGTGDRGVGSECLRKEQKYQKADQEYQEAKKETQHQLAIIQQDIQKLEKEREKYKEELKVSSANGLMARMNALHELPSGTSIAIILLLICIEVAPVFVKILSPYGPYDHVLKTVEYDYEIEEIASVNLRNQKLNNQLTVISGMEQLQVEHQLQQNKDTLLMIEKAHQELVKEQLDIWVEEEKKKLRDKTYQNETL